MKQFILLSLIFLISTLNSHLFAQKYDPVFTNGDVRRTLSDNWELDSSTRKGTFLILPYKPTYVIPARYSTNPNFQPASENPDYVLPLIVPYNKVEAKIQLSFKSKIMEGLFNGYGDVWVAYTQKSHWQVYNSTLSRPFRETNYEPEIILNFATNFKLLGFENKMIGVALNHQSNGRIVPLSRSWNRIIFHTAFEKENWQVYMRPWIRLKDDEDENPSILNFTGRGDMTVIHSKGKHIFTAIGRHSLNKSNRGNIQLDWAFPIKGYLKGHLQLFEGYGETMIDYNHKQTIIGLGVSLIEWM
jgi:phospholipase A1